MKKSKPERKDEHELFGQGPWMLRRKINGAFHAIFKELKEQDSDGFEGLCYNGRWSFWRIGSSFKLIFTKAPFSEFDWIKGKMFHKIY